MRDGHPRILIVRLSAIGDCMHAVPVLCALRDHLPGAMLGWVVEGRTSELLRGHPALDELIVAPRGWLKSPRAVWDLRRRLRALRFNVTVDVQGLTKSAIAARLSGAPRRLGLGGVDGREVSPWLNNDLVEAHATHVVERYLEVLRPLGITSPRVHFDLPRNALDERRAEEIAVAAGLTTGFAVINTGAGWPSKLWLPDRFAAVARYLGQACGLPSLVVWAGPQEQAAAEAIVAAGGGHARFAPATSLTELAAIVRRARLFVSSDTGPLHLAAAVGTPCVGLFGPVPADRNGPYGAGHMTVQKMCLTGGSRVRRHAGPESMRAITVDDVTRACDLLLGRPAKAA
ncbi:MAG: glycosyltransferase family 9 protein [Planctomycetia bacterium]|nr:glycosyltransferase family 9 protein [Planctomycetia bacterium]